MHNQLLVVVLALAAAFAFALSSSLKHVSAGQAPDAQSLRPGKLARFVWATLSHRLWLGGIGCDAVGLVLQILALHFGALAVVQPLLVTSLVFTLLLRRRFEHHHVSRQQLISAVVLTAALAGFVTLAGGSRQSAHEAADRLPAVVAGCLGALLAVGCVVLSRRSRSGRAAALLGIAVGIIYAATAALLKAASDIAVRGAAELFESWQLYTVVALGAAGLLLAQLAFQAGPITASLPATATVDPLLSIVVGVAVYDEHIRRGPGSGLLLVLLLVVLGGAAFQLTRTVDD